MGTLQSGCPYSQFKKVTPESIRGRAGSPEPLYLGASPVMMRPGAQHTTDADMYFLLQRGGFGRGRGQPPQ